jgi:hypothetical protein
MQKGNLVPNRQVPPPPTVDFPEEFAAWLEYLEIADPHAYRLFQAQADIDLS